MLKTPKNQRIAIIDECIRNNKYISVEKLAKRLLVSKKTVYRDIEDMKNKHKAPIEYSHLYNGYYYLDPDYAIKELMLTDSEIFGLLLAEKLLSQYENTPYEKRLRSAFMKLQRYIPHNIQMEETGQFQKSCSVELGFVRKIDVERFEFLIDAITQRKQLEIYYYTISRNEKKWRIIDPYHMKNYRGEWYLAAYCHNSSDIRSFSPVRILERKVTGRTFSVKEDFSADEYWANSFGIYRGKEGEVQDIHVWIDEYQSRWTNEIILDGDDRIIDVKRHADGSMTVIFRGGHKDEIKRWILQYGCHMSILKPEALREEMKKEIEGMRKNYGI